MLCAAVFLKAEMFDLLRLLCFGIFIWGTLLCAIWAYLAYPRLRNTSAVFGVIALVIVAAGIDAFLLEPHDLQIAHYKFKSAKLNHPLRIAVLSDLQTDNVGDYEEKALHTLMAQQPDLILFSGDYIQEYRRVPHNEQMQKLAQVFRSAQVYAPKGVFAVPGNVDLDDWQAPLQRARITTMPQLQLVHQIGLDVTGMSLAQSSNPHMKVERKSRAFHVVFGHSPNFMLGDIDADLLIAGHTHGGQIQLPFFGPPITMCAVPRNLAAGNMVHSKDGKYMVVTRGVGMERCHAPRLRFLCKPEIAVIDVIPATDWR